MLSRLFVLEPAAKTEGLNSATIEQLVATQFRLGALIQMLVDNRAFKKMTEAEVMNEIEARAQDLQFAADRDLEIKDRVEALLKAWNTGPKQ